MTCRDRGSHIVYPDSSTIWVIGVTDKNMCILQFSHFLNYNSKSALLKAEEAKIALYLNMKLAQIVKKYAHTILLELVVLLFAFPCDF